MKAQWSIILVLIASHCTEEASDVRRPPKINKSSERMKTFRDRGSVTLECKAEGTPEVTHVWQKDGKDLNLNIQKYKKAADGSLTIDPLAQDDEGFYQCMVHNQNGKAVSDLTQLRMAFLRTNPGAEIVKTATEGQPFHLYTTPPQSFPRPTFIWETAVGTNDPHPKPLDLLRRIQVDEDGNLHFACAQRGDKLDGRIYKSTSFNAITDERKGNNYAMVKIAQGNVTNSAPRLGFPSKETIALVGKNFTLRCFFYGCPEPDVSWDPPNRRSQVEGRYFLAKFNTELKINSVNKIDEGNYTCTGRNTEGQTKHIINVRVEAEPKFNQDSDAPRDINITEGDSVTINCMAEAKPEANVTWFRNGEPLNKNLPQKFSLTNGGKSLTIRGACRDCHDPDLAVIQCNASNVHGYAFASGYINVLKRTEVTVSRDLNVSGEIGKGNVYTFSCTVQSDPITVVQPQWHKRTKYGYDVRLPSEAYPNATLEGNNLTIRFTPNLNDSKWYIYLGEYFCEGDNKYSKSNKSVFLLNPGPTPPPPIPEPLPIMLLIIVSAVALFILLLVIIICCCWYWRGESYEVDKMEEKTDRDLTQELLDAEFQEYWRAGQQDRKRSNASQISFGRMTPTDGASLNEYNFDDVGQFAEDGSFVGNYKDMA